MKNAAKLVMNNLPKLRKNLNGLAKKDVLVGVPADEAARQDTDGMNNPTLAYIHDNGSPAQGIPPRPFMHPGIEAANGQVRKHLTRAAKGAVTKGTDPALGLERAGIVASTSIKNLISAGIAPELRPETIRNRRKSRNTKSMRDVELQYMQTQKMGVDSAFAQGALGIIPLVNTGQLRNSITYVVRAK